MDDVGWFADIDPDQEATGSSYYWQPNIQVDGACFGLSIWFDSEEECKRFINLEIIDIGMLDNS